MSLIDLSAQYRISGEKCRARARELHYLLRSSDIGDTEKILLRRRLTILEAMARETIEISNMLGKYYERSVYNADEGII